MCAASEKLRRGYSFLLALMLCFVVALGCACTAYAMDEENGSAANGEISSDELVLSFLERGMIDSSDCLMVGQELDMLVKVGFYLDDAFAVSQENGQNIYEFYVDDNLSSFVSVDRDEEGAITANVKEGDCSNEIVLANDGTLAIDGNTVEYESVSYGLPQFGNDTSTFNMAGSFFTTTNPCPNKTWVVHETVKEYINLGKAISKLSVSALAAAIKPIVGWVPSTTLKAAARYFIEKAPNSKYSSCKTVIYYPKGGRLFYNKNGVVKYAEKHARTMYPTKNCTGSIYKKKTVYRIIEIG